MKQKKNIIWDLSGTLVKPTEKHLTQKEREDFSFAIYMWGGKKDPSSLDNIALDLLGLMGQQTGSEIIRLHDGKPVPEIVCAFLAGKITSAQACHDTLDFFSTWKLSSELSEPELQLLEKKLCIFFDPFTYDRVIEPINSAVKLVALADQEGHRQYICSNWDKESFDLIYKKLQSPLFSFFKRQDIVISADAGYLKPQSGIYEYLIIKCNLIPSSCIFFDDQEENVEAALTFGIDGIQFSENETPDIKKLLKNS